MMDGSFLTGKTGKQVKSTKNLAKYKRQTMTEE